MVNIVKWTDPTLPIEFLTLKLVEEVGEVAREITDAIVWETDDVSEGFYEYVGHNMPRKKETIKELKQIESLAKTLRNRIERMK